MTIAHHWTHVLPGTKARLQAAMADPNGYIWETNAIDAREQLGRFPMGGEKYNEIIHYIETYTDTAKAKCAAYQSAVATVTRARNEGWLDKLTAEAVAYAAGCLPDAVYQGEAQDLADEFMDQKYMRSGG